MVAVTAAVATAIMVGLADMGRTTADRARARSAADAAALASLSEGRAAAVELATRHGAVLTSWRRGPGPHDVEVTVRVGDVTASARATDAP